MERRQVAAADRVRKFSDDLEAAQQLAQVVAPTVGVQEYEPVFEWAYRVRMRDGAMFFQPDLQYIVNPGGAHQYANALVVGASGREFLITNWLNSSQLVQGQHGSKGVARWGTRRRGRLSGPIVTELPRKTRLAPADKHRHQQEDQYPQPSHPTGLLSWQFTSVVNSSQFTTIVRHVGAHATQIEPLRRGFCDSRMPDAQKVLPGENCRGDFSHPAGVEGD